MYNSSNFNLKGDTDSSHGSTWVREDLAHIKVFSTNKSNFIIKLDSPDVFEVASFNAVEFTVQFDAILKLVFSTPSPCEWLSHQTLSVSSQVVREVV